MEPVQLQRLVDGELNFEETQQILKSAEDNPDLWRSIASSFVENQLWQSEFCGQHGFNMDSQLQTKPMRPVDSRSYFRTGWLALAASLLLAISIGGLLVNSDSLGPETQPVSLADNTEVLQNANALVDDPQLDDLNQRPAVYHRVQVEDPTGHQYVNSDVPLYSVDPSELQKFISKDDLPEDVRQRAADSGYGLQQNIRFLSGRLNDGRRFVIPVRKYSFFQGQ